jgi:hypothetical protein
MAIRPERITLPRNMAQIGRKDDTEVTITKHQPQTPPAARVSLEGPQRIGRGRLPQNVA